jgi:ribonucleotide monophosphatase NagD (HAD superfamily)
MSASRNYVTNGFVMDLSAVVNTSASGHRTLIPGAKEAISALQKQKVPFALVPRESRMTEKQVDRGLEKLLSLPIKSSSVVLPQTPFCHQVAEYRDKTVVIIGGDGKKARKQASKYGFEHVMTCQDIAQLYPHIYGKRSCATYQNLEKP